MSEIERGSNNIYQDLDFVDAEEMQAKAKLASHIISLIQKYKWSQEKAAVMLGLTQPKISLLNRGQFSGFSLGKLIKILNALNQDIQIIVISKPARKKSDFGKISVLDTAYRIHAAEPNSRATRLLSQETSEKYQIRRKRSCLAKKAKK